MIRLDFEHALPFLKSDGFDAHRNDAERAHQILLRKEGPGSEFLGWRELLRRPNDALLEDITATADEIRSSADVLLCIGIGGSYLGAKAVIQALTPEFGGDKSPSANRSGIRGPEILFAGHHMSGAYLSELLTYLEDRSVYVNVISKSGTTLEPALAFRLIREWMEGRFEDAARRIIVTTDPEEGVLNILHRELGYRKYTIPPDVGGRFSVLTPVGLLPIAAAGVDTTSLFYGAVSACDRWSTMAENPVLDYSAIRYALLKKKYLVDLFAVFEPRLVGMAQWWQQLFGESEGKQHTGFFPAFVQYSTDLHSLGQYVQEGQRRLIETFLMLEDDGGDIRVPAADGNLDKLDYLTGRTFTEINRAAYEGTAAAHAAGGVPNFTLWLDRLSAESLGEAIYFFEHAVAVGGYMLGINPFDQPGVEAYKKEMFKRLGRT